MADLDLEQGDEDAAEAISSREKRRRERAARSSTGGTASKPAKTSATKKQPDSGGDLVTRLVTAIDKIADQMAAREDHELATTLREEKRPMATGLNSLTQSVPLFRVPLVLLVDLLEPTLAFWRVGRLLVGRWFDRQARRQAEYDGQNAYAVTPDGVAVAPQ